VIHEYTLFVHQVSHTFLFDDSYHITVVCGFVRWYEHLRFDAVIGNLDIRGDFGGCVQVTIFNDSFRDNVAAHSIITPAKTQDDPYLVHGSLSPSNRSPGTA
jgi:hypothetical protein